MAENVIEIAIQARDLASQQLQLLTKFIAGLQAPTDSVNASLVRLATSVSAMGDASQQAASAGSALAQSHTQNIAGIQQHSTELTKVQRHLAEYQEQAVVGFRMEGKTLIPIHADEIAALEKAGIAWKALNDEKERGVALAARQETAAQQEIASLNQQAEAVQRATTAYQGRIMPAGLNVGAQAAVRTAQQADVGRARQLMELYGGIDIMGEMPRDLIRNKGAMYGWIRPRLDAAVAQRRQEEREQLQQQVALAEEIVAAQGLQPPVMGEQLPLSARPAALQAAPAMAATLTAAIAPQTAVGQGMLFSAEQMEQASQRIARAADVVVKANTAVGASAETSAEQDALFTAQLQRSARALEQRTQAAPPSVLSPLALGRVTPQQIIPEALLEAAASPHYAAAVERAGQMGFAGKQAPAVAAYALAGMPQKSTLEDAVRSVEMVSSRVKDATPLVLNMAEAWRATETPIVEADRASRRFHEGIGTYGSVARRHLVSLSAGFLMMRDPLMLLHQLLYIAMYEGIFSAEKWITKLKEMRAAALATAEAYRLFQLQQRAATAFEGAAAGAATGQILTGAAQYGALGGGAAVAAGVGGIPGGPTIFQRLLGMFGGGAGAVGVIGVGITALVMGVGRLVGAWKNATDAQDRYVQLSHQIVRLDMSGVISEIDKVGQEFEKLSERIGPDSPWQVRLGNAARQLGELVIKGRLTEEELGRQAAERLAALPGLAGRTGFQQQREAAVTGAQVLLQQRQFEYAEAQRTGQQEQIRRAGLAYQQQQEQLLRLQYGVGLRTPVTPDLLIRQQGAENAKAWQAIREEQDKLTAALPFAQQFGRTPEAAQLEKQLESLKRWRDVELEGPRDPLHQAELNAQIEETTRKLKEERATYDLLMRGGPSAVENLRIQTQLDKVRSEQAQAVNTSLQETVKLRDALMGATANQLQQEAARLQVTAQLRQAESQTARQLLDSDTTGLANWHERFMAAHKAESDAIAANQAQRAADIKADLKRAEETHNVAQRATAEFRRVTQPALDVQEWQQFQRRSQEELTRLRLRFPIQLEIDRMQFELTLQQIRDEIRQLWGGDIQRRIQQALTPAMYDRALADQQAFNQETLAAELERSREQERIREVDAQKEFSQTQDAERLAEALTKSELQGIEERRRIREQAAARDRQVDADAIRQRTELANQENSTLAAIWEQRAGILQSQMHLEVAPQNVEAIAAQARQAILIAANYQSQSLENTQRMRVDLERRAYAEGLTRYQDQLSRKEINEATFETRVAAAYQQHTTNLTEIDRRYLEERVQFEEQFAERVRQYDEQIMRRRYEMSDVRVIVEGMRNAFGDFESTVGGTLGDFMTGRLRSWADAWNSMWQSLARSAANSLTRLLFRPFERMLDEMEKGVQDTMRTPGAGLWGGGEYGGGWLGGLVTWVRSQWGGGAETAQVAETTRVRENMLANAIASEASAAAPANVLAFSGQTAGPQMLTAGLATMNGALVSTSTQIQTWAVELTAAITSMIEATRAAAASGSTGGGSGAGLGAALSSFVDSSGGGGGGGAGLGTPLSTIGEVAEGTLARRPTLALIGEAGPELVLPLKDRRRMNELAAQAGYTMVPLEQTIRQYAEGGLIPDGTAVSQPTATQTPPMRKMGDSWYAQTPSGGWVRVVEPKPTVVPMPAGEARPTEPGGGTIEAGLGEREARQTGPMTMAEFGTVAKTMGMIGTPGYAIAGVVGLASLGAYAYGEQPAVNPIGGAPTTRGVQAARDLTPQMAAEIAAERQAAIDAAATQAAREAEASRTVPDTQQAQAARAQAAKEAQEQAEEVAASSESGVVGGLGGLSGLGGLGGVGTGVEGGLGPGGQLGGGGEGGGGGGGESGSGSHGGAGGVGSGVEGGLGPGGQLGGGSEAGDRGSDTDSSHGGEGGGGLWQRGGFVRRRQIIEVGEAGPELVLPLKDRRRMRDLAKQAGYAMVPLTTEIRKYAEGGLIGTPAPTIPTLPVAAATRSPSHTGDVTVINLTRPEELDALMASSVARGSRVVVNEVIQGLMGNRAVRRVIQRTQ